ncbi:hypothetical protein MNBD_BACTEROID05-885 [hydrothermal vent metagenome]|uniref:DUF7674 domain-containing protein n=1 Tax=hydrothermal vent metagenome TaxID=652676 RepID=A0A3B0UDF6_9ZZZZ
MITESECMEYVLKVCPGYASDWQKHLEGWEGEEVELFIHTASFAQYAVKYIESDDEQELKMIANAIEYLHGEGDDGVRQAIEMGFLETLIGHCNHNPKKHPVRRFTQFFKGSCLDISRAMSESWEKSSDEGGI